MIGRVGAGRHGALALLAVALGAGLLGGCMATTDTAETIAQSKPIKRVAIAAPPAQKPQAEKPRTEKPKTEKAENPPAPTDTKTQIQMLKPTIVVPDGERGPRDPMVAWCQQRHVDSQAGRSPGGAETLDQKLEDDRICARILKMPSAL